MRDEVLRILRMRPTSTQMAFGMSAVQGGRRGEHWTHRNPTPSRAIVVIITRIYLLLPWYVSEPFVVLLPIIVIVDRDFLIQILRLAYVSKEYIKTDLHLHTATIFEQNTITKLSTS